MGTKTKTAAEANLTAADLASAIVRQKHDDDQAAAEARARDTEVYKKLIRELAESVERPENMLLAARIVGERLGFNADADLRHLDAISHEASLVAEHGDLAAYEQELNRELSLGAEREMAIRERHLRELESFRESNRELGRKSILVGTAVEAARAARVKVGHLEIEVQ